MEFYYLIMGGRECPLLAGSGPSWLTAIGQERSALRHKASEELS